MITLSQFQLKEVINQTIFSIAINDNNKMMTGELFEVNEGTLKVVGLDGHRIAIRNIKLEGRSDDVRVVIPGKTLQEISKILMLMLKVLLIFTLLTIMYYLNLTRLMLFLDL